MVHCLFLPLVIIFPDSSGNVPEQVTANSQKNRGNFPDIFEAELAPPPAGRQDTPSRTSISSVFPICVSYIIILRSNFNSRGVNSREKFRVFGHNS